MGHGTVAGKATRLLACLLLSTVAATGCQPLYGGRPEKLKSPGRPKKVPEVATETVEVKYVEECTASFQEDPRLVRPNSKISGQLVQDGDVALQSANQAKDGKAQGELIKASIEKYRNALIKDPYNQEATLKLALAYDLVLRKGCAIAMLKRLASMQANPAYAKAANAKADMVSDNPTWFKGYRKDAMAAVGR